MNSVSQAISIPNPVFEFFKKYPTEVIPVSVCAANSEDWGPNIVTNDLPKIAITDELEEAVGDFCADILGVVKDEWGQTDRIDGQFTLRLSKNGKIEVDVYLRKYVEEYVEIETTYTI